MNKLWAQCREYGRVFLGMVCLEVIVVLIRINSAFYFGTTSQKFWNSRSLRIFNEKYIISNGEKSDFITSIFWCKLLAILLNLKQKFNSKRWKCWKRASLRCILFPALCPPAIECEDSFGCASITPARSSRDTNSSYVSGTFPRVFFDFPFSRSARARSRCTLEMRVAPHRQVQLVFSRNISKVFQTYRGNDFPYARHFFSPRLMFRDPRKTLFPFHASFFLSVAEKCCECMERDVLFPGIIFFANFARGWISKVNVEQEF